MTPSAGVVREPTWNYNDLLLFVFLSVVSVAVTQALIWIAIQIMHVPKGDRVLMLLPSQVMLYILLLGALFAIIKLQYGRKFLEALAWVDFRFSAANVVSLGLLLAVFNALASVPLHPPQIDTPLKHLFERRITAIEFGLLGTTLAPICEELVFRGFMQPVFVRSLGPAIGILVTAVLFGSLHLAQNGFAWQSGVLITIAGVAFGWMRHLSRSTRASTLMHASYNSVLFLAAFYAPGIQAVK